LLDELVSANHYLTVANFAPMEKYKYPEKAGAENNFCINYF
jgi:hypothetical protein